MTRAERGGRVRDRERARAEQEMQTLAQELARHDDLYYNQASPEISDAAYDAMRRRLADLATRYSPPPEAEAQLAKVGAPPSDDGLLQARHGAPMLSLNNAMDEPQAEEFFLRARRFLSMAADAPLAVVMEPKYDGVAVSLRYEAGVLARIATRGDGQIGEDITRNRWMLAGLPERLATAPEVIEVRCEAFIARDDFVAFNKARVAAGEGSLANPRNAVVGALRRLDAKVGDVPAIRFAAYDWRPAAALSVPTYAEGMARLAGWGMPVSVFTHQAQAWPEIAKAFDDFAAQRQSWLFEADGVVLKINDLALRERMGDVGRRPRWAVAWKFEAEEALAKVEAVSMRVGQSGAITPVAELEPTPIEGVVVRRATLHNLDFLKKKDVRAGDFITLRRAGGVIPQVVRARRDLRAPEVEAAGPTPFPTLCPSCGDALEQVSADTDALVCPNRAGCPARVRERLMHFAARSALDIEGLGETTLATLYDAGLVRDWADIFSLERRLRDNPPDFWRYGAKAAKGKGGTLKASAEKLFAAIRARRAPDLDRFLIALGIPKVGPRAAEALAEETGDWDALLARVRGGREGQGGAALDTIDGVGVESAKAIVDFLITPDIVRALDALRQEGVHPKPRQASATQALGATPLAGKSVVFSGALDGMTRAEANARARAAGARVVAAMSKHVDWLITEQKPQEGKGKTSAKVAKAVALGKAILNTAAFRQALLGEAPKPNADETADLSLFPTKGA